VLDEQLKVARTSSELRRHATEFGSPVFANCVQARIWRGGSVPIPDRADAGAGIRFELRHQSQMLVVLGYILKPIEACTVSF
jgi:hypothetical protein